MNETQKRTTKRGAKEAMAEIESYVRDLVHQLHKDGVLDHHPCLAALVDEAKGQVEDLRKARINL